MRFFAKLFLFLALLVLPIQVLAQDSATVEPLAPSVYERAKILDITAEGTRGDVGLEDGYQDILMEILSGPDAHKVVSTEYVTPAASFARQKLHKGDTLVVTKTNDVRGDNYYVVDVFRLPILGIFAVLFFLAAAVFGRAKGVGAILGLAVSVAILLLFVVPRIFAGENPLLICGIGSVAIAFASVLLAHGFNRRTYVALGATLLALLSAFILAALAVKLTALSGSGTEEAMFLQLNYLTGIDLQGLLLGGIVIGALGVLDDVTTAQVAAVEEIHNANESLDFKELYKRGSSVGREHIAALVNTLALAYVGASFPIFLLFAMPDSPPLWALLNTEQIVEEIIRALVGGGALMLAVPISTVFAAWYFAGRKVTSIHSRGSHHH